MQCRVYDFRLSLILLPPPHCRPSGRMGVGFKHLGRVGETLVKFVPGQRARQSDHQLAGKAANAADKTS